MFKRAILFIIISCMLRLSILAAPMRIASVQMEVTDSLETNLARIQKGMKEVKAAGARVVLFPEMALSGFSEAAIKKNREALPEAEASIAALAEKHALYKRQSPANLNRSPHLPPADRAAGEASPPLRSHHRA